MKVFADTSALVALINPADGQNRWALCRWEEWGQPVRTCEAVLAEAFHILRRVSAGPSTLLEMWECGAVEIDFSLKDNSEAVRSLMTKYQSVPMSLADACLVRMSEIYEGGKIWTLDSDFRIYRKNGRQVIPVIMPEKAS